MTQETKDISGEAVSLVETAYNRILLQIVEDDLPSGAELKTTTLANQLGLSRTPVVQALQRLIADGIVTQVRQQRAVVAKGAGHWLVDVHEMRQLLEPKAAFHAATRLELEEIERLSDSALAAEPTESNVETWIPYAHAFDFQLHTTIAQASGNLPLSQAICKCMSFKRLTYAVSEDSRDLLRRDYSEHLMILDALKKRDPETASAAMLFHLRNSVEFRKPGANII